MEPETAVHVNLWGYQATFYLGTECRTYACTDKTALAHLVLRLTGRELDSYPPGPVENSWVIPGVTIAYPLHIYSAA